MNKKINIILAALLVFVGFGMTSCSDDEPTVAKAVLASVSVLNFDGQNAAPQEIRVVSDATWQVDAPDWIQVSQTTGAGDLMVTITALDNVRDGALDNPRRGEIIFHGDTKASQAVITVRQDGDKYRDLAPSSISDLNTVENETVVLINNLAVVAVTDKGFVATDGTNNVYVTSNETVTAGSAVNISGTKFTDAQKFPYVECERVEAGTTAPAVPAAIDITEQLDTYTSATRTLVSVQGVLDGSAISVNGKTNSVLIDDAAKTFDSVALQGHIVKVTGLYGGTAAPAVHLVVTSVEDLGVFDVIYWAEDFEWLAEWAAIGNGEPCGDTVATSNSDANAPQLGTPKIDGISAYQALLDKGYSFLAVHHESKSDRVPEKQIYLQSNYLKFGLTGYQSGIVFPAIDNVPAGETVELQFDWSPMVQGSGKIDNVNLLIIVENNGSEQQFTVPTHTLVQGDALGWINATIRLDGVEITGDTKISMRNYDAEWPASTANRWFLDNVKLKKAK